MRSTAIVIACKAIIPPNKSSIIRVIEILCLVRGVGMTFFCSCSLFLLIRLSLPDTLLSIPYVLICILYPYRGRIPIVSVYAGIVKQL